LEFRRDFAYRGSADPEHLAQKFLRQRELAAGNPVVSHQQPSGATLFYGMAAVACCALRHLHHQHLHVAIENCHEWAAALQFFFKCLLTYAEAFSWYLRE
jgi:hypothetical protein